jgi:KDO2-lipid IV(A) lauroyltransferase
MMFFRFLSRLPFGILYGISDVLHFLMRYIVRYRREVILENLRLSFPEKSAAEIQSIMNGFYHNLADIIVETVKIPGMSAEEMRRHVRITNAEAIRARIQAGETVIAMGSHQCNWEWYAQAIRAHDIPIDIVYKPLTSEFSGKLLFYIRSHFGGNVVSMHSLPRHLAANRHNPRLIALGSDQVPDIPEQAFWTDFLHRDSPFYPGSERLSRRQKLPVFYLDITRIRRGYYEATIKPVAEPPYDDLPLGSIMERYRDLIEYTIRKHPSNWLWSHKRWKHWREKYAKIVAKLN